MKKNNIIKYHHNSHIIYQADILEALGQIEDSSIDLIFADPPYNIGKNFNGFKDKWDTEQAYVDWCYSWIETAIKKLKPFGCFYLMASTQAMPYFDLFLRKHLTILSRIIWQYDSSGVQAKNHFGSLYEPILFCVKNKYKYTFNSSEIQIKSKTGFERNLIDYRKSPPQKYNSFKVPGNVWDYPRVRYKMEEYQSHPTQKPTALLDRIIKASTNKGDLILDLFSGSFTTAFVADRLERNTINIEINGEYIQIGLQRLKAKSEIEDIKLSKVDIQPINNFVDFTLLQ